MTWRSGYAEVTGIPTVETDFLFTAGTPLTGPTDSGQTLLPHPIHHFHLQGEDQ